MEGQLIFYLFCSMALPQWVIGSQLACLKAKQCPYLQGQKCRSRRTSWRSTMRTLRFPETSGSDHPLAQLYPHLLRYKHFKIHEDQTSYFMSLVISYIRLDKNFSVLQFLLIIVLSPLKRCSPFQVHVILIVLMLSVCWLIRFAGCHNYNDICVLFVPSNSHDIFYLTLIIMPYPVGSV